jgi:hypothetical protein
MLTTEIPIDEKAETSAIEITTKAAAHVTTILDSIKDMEIRTTEDHVNAGTLLKTVKDSYRLLEKRRKEVVDPINQLKSKIQGLFKPDLDKYVKAEKLLKGAILKYQQKQEQIRRAEQERIRKQTEAQEEKRRKELREQAERAAQKGNQQKAAEKLQQAEEYHKPVPILQETPKVDGIIEVKTWKARPANGAAEYDKKLIPEGFLLVNEKLLNEAARSTKGLVPIPGVEFYQESSITARS